MARVYRDPTMRNAEGKPAWCIDYMGLDGGRHRDRTNAATREMAQRILRKKLEEIEMEKIRGVRPVRPIAFEEFLPEYLAHVCAVRSKTSQVRVASFTKVLSRTFGRRILGEVTGGDVQRWVDARSQERTRSGSILRPATVVSEFVCLSAIFREARKRGYVASNPCHGISLPKVNNKITRCLSEDQEARLLAACSQEFRSIVVTALLTGLRRGELLELQWGDVDFDTRILTVVHGKGEKMRHIPMVPELARTLEAFPRFMKEGDVSPYVFNNPETGTRWVDIKKQWARALRIAAIRSFRFHDLRHTFASRLVQRGAPLKAVQELLGHADLKMTMRYAHLAPSDLRDAISLLVPTVGRRMAEERKGQDRETA